MPRARSSLEPDNREPDSRSNLTAARTKPPLKPEIVQPKDLLQPESDPSIQHREQLLESPLADPSRYLEERAIKGIPLGELEVVNQIPNKVITDKKENSEDQNNNEKLSDGGTERDAFVTETSKMPFLMLGLDLPPPPLFKDVMEKNTIP